MKKAILILLCTFMAGTVLSQADTLFTKKKGKIPCRIIEISESEIRYNPKLTGEGPVIVIDKSAVFKYTLSNGFSEVITNDEMSLDNEHQDIMNNRCVIKFHPFSIMNNQISVAYEQVIKVGMNLDVEAGYVNNALNENPLFRQVNYTSDYTGFYIKPGLKFFTGRDYRTKGLKYAHPLKGTYLRLELALSAMSFNKLIHYDRVSGGPVHTDLRTLAGGVIINFGRQLILGNIMTLDYYGGIGYTMIGYSQTSPVPAPVSHNYFMMASEHRSFTNYHGFARIADVGLTFSAGLRIGFILPEPKASRPLSAR